jgi:hypothetical protein
LDGFYVSKVNENIITEVNTLRYSENIKAVKVIVWIERKASEKRTNDVTIMNAPY